MRKEANFIFNLKSEFLLIKNGKFVRRNIAKPYPNEKVAEVEGEACNEINCHHEVETSFENVQQSLVHVNFLGKQS